MRILFDGFWWESGPYSNRQVLREFVFAWLEEFPEDEVIVAVKRSAYDLARRELPDTVDIRTTRLSPQGVVAMVELPLIARSVHADITLTHNFSPLVGRSAVFVHDLMFESNPEWFTTRERAYFSFMTRTLRRADVALTSSATEARRIEAVGRPRHGVVNVGLGFPPGLTSTTPRAPQDVDGAESFLLVVGRLNVRKNLGVALEAAVRSGKIDPRHPLIVVGEPSGKSAELPPEFVAARDAGSIRFTGFISDDELAWLYQHASLFLFLSLDEGFGLPNLEALYFGAPVLASDIAVFREILGSRATFVDPRDVTAVAEGIRSASTHQRPSSLSPETLGYSWSASVQRIRAAIEL